MVHVKKIVQLVKSKTVNNLNKQYMICMLEVLSLLFRTRLAILPQIFVLR